MKTETVKSYGWKGSYKYSYKNQPIIFSDNCLAIEKEKTYLIYFHMVKGAETLICWVFENEEERDGVFEQLKTA